jgi:negative regulator of flagellin synthesis FlgM
MVGDIKKTNNTVVIEHTKQNAKNTPKAKPINNETIELISESDLLTSIEKKHAEVSEVDMGKVAEIKAAIASGKYEIDTDTIVEKMLDDL